MAITLGGITLPDLVIVGEMHFCGVQCETSKTLDGGLIVWEQEMVGEPINLVGRSDSAWITRKTLFDVRDLAKVPKAEYVLEYEGEISNVRFRHENGPVVSAVPVVERPNHSDDDWYAGVYIKLMGV